MSFFSTVHYAPLLQDKGWVAKAEAAADVCRAPARWICSEFQVLDKGRVYYYIENLDSSITAEERESKPTKGMRKAMRIMAGILLSIPGQLLGSALMGIAFTSKEIRLKHQTVSTLSTKEKKEELQRFVDERRRVANEQQGCDSISCSLCTIICLLCYIACCAN
ncbi:MAG: hypothetical protein WB791_06660 [Waddliaceae bacterium]